jgi:glycosyltransferase involved in cell wall biosynthesis
MSDAPTVSIVMAARNYGQYIAMAIDSVRAQTIDNWELVIINDGSTDDTDVVVSPYLNDCRVKYHASDRLGQSRAKNLGVRLSRGELIAFLDADDAWRPTKLEQQLRAMCGRVGVVHTAREIIGEVLPSRQSPFYQGVERRTSFDSIYTSNPICFSSTLVRREAFDYVGGFDPDLDLSIDYDLWLRVAQHYDFVMIDEPLTLYRTGHANLSKRLADRIMTAFSIMHRHDDAASPAARAHAFAETCRSMAWAVRGAEPVRAMTWYARALRWPSLRGLSLRGLIGVGIDRLLRRARTTAAENLSVNG